MSSKKRGRIEFKAFPVWSDWANKIINELPNGGRKGIPRGERIPFDLKKSACGLLATIYPRGIKTAGELGGYVGISADLVRKWRREASFQAFVQDLEVEFALRVLANLKNETFFNDLYRSYWEPFAWGDTVQDVFYHEIISSPSLEPFLEKLSLQKLKGISLKVREKLRANLNYTPILIELPHSNTLFLDFLFQSMSYDLAVSVQTTWRLSHRRIRGKKPYSKSRYRTWDSFEEVHKKYPRESLTRIIEAIEQLINENRPKEDLLLGVNALKQTINILYPPKADMGQDESTTV